MNARYGERGWQRERRSSHAPCAVLAGLLLVCCANDRHVEPLPADARTILQASLSHGIGESPLDSPLLVDSLAATLLVRFRRCTTVNSVPEVVSMPEEAHRYIDELASTGLLKVQDGDMCTAFPILIDGDQAAYARLTSGVADEAAAVLLEEITSLLDELRDRGWAEWQYHFVWSQVFDSQYAWVAMTRRGLVPPLARVIAWSIYPDHPYRSGTNYFPDDALRDYWLMVTWRPDAANTVAAISTWWQVMYGVALEGRPLSAMERDTLATLGLVDRTGTLQLPVLRENDALLETLEALAARYVEFLDQRLPVDSLTPLTGVDARHTFAMAYHDVSWGIMQRLVDLGQLPVPAGLTAARGGLVSPMQGVAAIVPVDRAFADLLREALEGR